MFLSLLLVHTSLARQFIVCVAPALLYVVQAGGFIEDDDGCHRVGGLLAVSRAIGDHYLKKFVICDPDVKCHKRVANQAFLVLGSDGLWDDIEPSDVANLLGYDGGKIPRTKIQITACAKKMVQLVRRSCVRVRGPHSTRSPDLLACRSISIISLTHQWSGFVASRYW